MPVPSHHSSASSQFGPYGVFVMPPQSEPSTALEPGERLGGPMARKRPRIFSVLLVVAVSVAGGWTWLNHREDVEAFAARASGFVQELQQRRPPAEQAEALRPEPPPPLVEKDVASAPLSDNAPVAMQYPMARAAEPASPSDDRVEPTTKPSSTERLPAVAVDPADVLQQRALAAGLHPALSRALLERLTSDDFRNAAHAVRVALEQGLGAEPVIWPRRRGGGQAQFKVKQVEGAPTCRRYVVQIAKDGWETTARPMETCQSAEAAKR